SQLFTGFWKVASAIAPASRSVAARFWRSPAELRPPSLARNGQPLQAQRGRIGAIAELEVVGGRQRAEHVDEIARDGHLAHRIGTLPILDPEAGCAAAIV